MNKITKTFAGLIVLAGLASPLQAQDTRQVTIIEDRDQTYFTTKVYTVKNTKANDLTPFVLTAVKANNGNSTVNRINCTDGTQLLVVTMDEEMVPYIDDMVATLDRAGKKDAKGSSIDNTSTNMGVYKPKFRPAEDILHIMQTATFQNDQDRYYEDDTTGNILYKGSPGKLAGGVKWLSKLDRPIPQVELELTVYEINDNDYRDLGIDYQDLYSNINGTLFTWGWSGSAHSSGPANDASVPNYDGLSFFPRINTTFLRLLEQDGKAKLATTGTIVLTNASKDSSVTLSDFNQQSVAQAAVTNVKITDDDNDFADDIKFTADSANVRYDNTCSGAEILAMQFDMQMRSLIETDYDSVSTAMNEQSVTNVKTTLKVGTTKVLATFSKEHSVEQFVGVPYLCDVPYLKYLFGNEVTSKASTKYVVVGKIKSVNPAANLSEVAGNYITEIEEEIK